MKLPVSGVSMLSSMYLGSTAPSGISLSVQISPKDGGREAAREELEKEGRVDM